MGDTLRILGRPFEIVGLTHTDGYAPDLYDVRRLRAGAEDLAGVDLDRRGRKSSRPGLTVPS